MEERAYARSFTFSACVMVLLTKDQIRVAYQDGLKRLKTGDLFGAQQRFEAVAQAAGSAAEPRFQLGKVALALGWPKTAVERLEEARERAPTQPEILLELAQAYARTGNIDGALAIHAERAKADPTALAHEMDRALLLQQNGDFDAAEKIFRKCYPRGKTSPEFFRLWFAGRKLTNPGEPALKIAKKLWTHPRLNAHGRLHLGFALAKAMEDLGRSDQVFKYLDAANAAQASLAAYDRGEREDRIAEMRRIAGEGPVVRRGTSEAAPIFIVGMPRSGTTLIEQILAAHPQVRAGGEIAQIRPMAYLTLGGPGHLPVIADISDESLRLYADRYARCADETAAGTAPRICDKSMQTQLILGLVAAAFPKAHFIVVRRDPRDVALSIYKNHFLTGTHSYSTRLEDIAHQMHTFDRAIAFWKEQIPLTEIHYENLVSDPEAQTRALVAAVGLPWDDACLDHRSGNAAVKTLSIAQVRKPIYASSRGGWRRYEKEMMPFIDAWEAYS